MEFKRIEIDEKYTKTYATVENLNRALLNLGITIERHLLCYSKSGRVTAVFIGAENLAMIHHGFMVVG